MIRKEQTMTKPLSDKQQLKAFINAAQYLAGLTSGQDVWEEAGKVLVRFFGADVAAFGTNGPDNGITIEHWTFSSKGASARLPETEMLPPVRDVFESGFLTFLSPPSDAGMATAFLPVLHENKVVAVLLAGHLESGGMRKDTLDLYLAIAGLIGAAYSRDVAAKAVLRANEELERRVAERTAELEAANRELEAFAYSVSHDLRAPLRAIDGFTRAIEEEQAHKLDDEGKENFGRVRAAAAKMGQLIDALLNLSRMTRVKMDRVPVDLSHMARAFADELRKTRPDRKAEFVIAGGVIVTGDPAMLQAALDNLLENAWKFTEKRDTARIEFGVMEMRSADGGVRNDSELVYFVRDNGAGFDMSFAPKLFCAFQRLHSIDDFPGMGIGLATVQRIIRRHGGRIWAEGEPGTGATFYFTL
jgi:signal transduction histidine kinase